MYFVKPNVIGEDGLGCIDPDRMDRLPAKTWRPVPKNPYWLRLSSMGDVQLLTERPPEEEIEGYVAPEEAAKPAVEPEEAAKLPRSIPRKGSDA